MSPPRTLNELSRAKSALQRRIAARRQRHIALVRRATRPMAWLDLGWRLWRDLAPVVKLLRAATKGHP